MNSPNASYNATAVAERDVEIRSEFITRTYMHLFGAIVGFIALEVLLFKSGLAEPIARAMFGMPWLVILGGFMVVGWLASNMAHRAAGLGLQYAALAAYVVAEAFIFIPLLYIAETYAPGVILSAAQVTLMGFALLTGVVLITRKDFSFLKGILFWGFISAVLLIVAGTIFGFQLGTYFSVGMVILAGGAILYDTSKVLHHYPEDRYVAASLELFASVALLFWYVLRLFLNRR